MQQQPPPPPPESLEEFESAKAVVVLAAIVAAQQFFSMLRPGFSWPEWESALWSFYPRVREFSLQAAELSRGFYDVQREKFLTQVVEDFADVVPEFRLPGFSIPRHDFLLPELSFEVFVAAMESARSRVAGAESAQDAAKAAAVAASRVARIVEDSARRTMVKGMDTDDPFFEHVRQVVEPHLKSGGSPRVVTPEDIQRQGLTQQASMVRGWARIPTGRETCAWCWMLCSAGVRYRTASSGGSKLTNVDALAVGSSMNAEEHMNRWHDNCDCTVVPVFDLHEFPGRERSIAAYTAWKRVVKDKGLTGQEAFNAFRRKVEKGYIQEIMAEKRKYQ